MPYDDAQGRDLPADAAETRDHQAAVRTADAPTRERDREREKERPPAQPPREDKPRDDKPRQDAKAEGKAADDKGSDDEKKDDDKKRRSPWMWIILGVAILAAAIGGGVYWYATKDQASTDDAYTDGRAITIAPKVSGYVVELDVNDNQFVHAGDVIIRIEPRDFIAARDQARGQVEAAQGQLAGARAALEVARKNFPARLASAQAQLQSARATLFKAQADDRRQHAVSRGATTQEQVDQADAALLQAQAGVAQAEAAVQEATPVQENIAQSASVPSQIEGQVAQAQAQLAQAELNLGYTVVRAPQDGWITKRNVEMGNYVDRRRLDHVASVAAGLGDGELQGEPARPHAARPACRHFGRRVSRPEAARPCGQRPTRVRLEVQRLPGGERDRQLRQDRAARAGEDRHRQRPRPQPAVAARHLRRTHHLLEVMHAAISGKWPADRSPLSAASDT